MGLLERCGDAKCIAECEQMKARAEAAERQVAALNRILTRIEMHICVDDEKQAYTMELGAYPDEEIDRLLPDTAATAEAYEARIREPLEKRIAELESANRDLKACSNASYQALRNWLDLSKEGRDAEIDARIKAEAAADERRRVLDIVVSEAAAQVDLKPHQEAALRTDILAALGQQEEPHAD